MGSWTPDSLKFMNDLESRVTETTGERCAKSFLFQSLSKHASTKRKCPMCNWNSSSPQKTGRNLQSRNNFDTRRLV